MIHIALHCRRQPIRCYHRQHDMAPSTTFTQDTPKLVVYCIQLGRRRMYVHAYASYTP